MKTNNITYRRVGDYNIPNLILPPEEANIHLGKWGERVPEALKRANRPSRRQDMLHKDYLQKHKPVVEQNEREGVCCRATQR